MEKSGLEQERQARFDLAEVGVAVKDYYDLLFDNVEEFIDMNHEEAREYEAENIELAKMLAAGGTGHDEAESIRSDIRGNNERIDGIHRFLNGRGAVKAGIELSAELIDDNEPELTDRFNAAPVAEKYACLVNRYMDENRRALDDDPSQSDPLAEIDAFRFATERVREFFPKVAEQYEEHKREEHRDLLKSDPNKLHSDLMVRYSTEYVASAGKRMLELLHTRDAFQSGLREHDAAKPGWLKNLATLGEAGKTWEDERGVLTREIAGCESEMAKQQKLREECRDVWLPEPARQYAKGEIASRHPEVVEACERHMARRWEKENEARLERQAKRDGGNEPTKDNGLSR
jgi:hypothetical protein